MPSCWATRRASSTSATEQHPESDGPPHSLRVAPTTSWPSSTRSAAATEESTPPDIATSTRMRPVCHPDVPPDLTGHDFSGAATQRGDHPRHDGQGAVDVGPGGVVPQREADGPARQVVGHPHGGQHVARLEGATGARGPTGRADTPFAQGQQELFSFDAAQAEVEMSREDVHA